MQNKFLQEAIRIGDQLILSAEKTPFGITWKTRGSDAQGNVIGTSTEDIYTGVSGIVLFLLALYKITNNKKYMAVSEKAMLWVEWYCRQHPTNYYAFYSGRMGVSFTFLKLYEGTKKKRYLTKALAIAKESISFLKEPYTVNDLLNGISGTLLGLLHLHAQTKEPWVLDYIQKYTNALLQNARFDKAGLYWDSDPQEVRPLCGFSHGSSGIGFVFLELGHYLQNPAYYYVADQAFSYDNAFFDRKINNWPLFRIMLYSEKECEVFESFYKNKQFSYFTKYTDKNAWCHGSAGIGLSRIRALELFTNSQYRQDLSYALKKTQFTQTSTFTLCHGMGGNMDLLIENSLLTRDNKAIDYVQGIAQKALEQKEKEKQYLSGFKDTVSNKHEELSLFNGVSGVGYFLLRSYNPEEVPSILAPKLTEVYTYVMQEKDSLPSLKRLLLKNIFPRTIALAEQFIPKDLQHYFQQKKQSKSELSSFIAFIKQLIPSLADEQQSVIKDYFALEMIKVRLLKNRTSNGLLYIKERLNTKAAKKLLLLSDALLTEQKLSLSSEIKLYATAHPEYTAYLLKLTPYGIAEVQVNDFCYQVLSCFAKTKSVKTAIEVIYQQYKTKSTKDVILNNAQIQIREAIDTGILVPQTLDKET